MHLRSHRTIQYEASLLGPVVRMVDSTIHRIGKFLTGIKVL
jgi:hypothetical protein